MINKLHLSPKNYCTAAQMPAVKGATENNTFHVWVLLGKIE